MNYTAKPNSPEALEIAKRIGQQDREEHAGKKPLVGKVKISDEKRDEIYADRVLGMPLAEVAKKHGIALSTAQRIVKEEMDKRTTTTEAGKIDGYAVRMPRICHKEAGRIRWKPR